jgi:hypothetical protein
MSEKAASPKEAMEKRKRKDYLDAAAQAVWTQVEENPDIAVPVDPDVADHMGFFLDPSISDDEVDDIDMKQELQKIYEEAPEDYYAKK